MQFFVDSADLTAIQELAATGMVDGGDDQSVIGRQIGARFQGIDCRNL